MPLDIEELRRVPFLAGLPEETFARVATWFEERHPQPGENLAPEGASGYTFFVILEGTATVVHDGKTVATLGPGDFFGEGAPLGAMFGTEFRLLERDCPEVGAQTYLITSRRHAPRAILESSSVKHW